MTDTSGVTPEVIDELKRRREERDRANAALVTQRNTVLETAPPDDVAYDLAKAKELNLPREAIAADRDRYKQEDTLARFDRLRKEAPKTSEWLAAPENFAVSRDDVDTLVSSEKELDPWLTESGGRLMSMSRTWNAFFNNVGGAARAALPGFKAQGAGLVQQQAESLSAYDAELRAFEASRDGSIQIEVGDFTLKFNPAWFGVGDQRPEAPLIARMLNLEDPSGLVLRQPGPDKFRAEARKRYDAILKPLAAEAKRIGREAAAEQKALMPQTGDFVADSLLSGVTAFINMGPAIAGFAVGGPTVGAGIMGGQVYGQVYGEGRNEYGLEPTAANERAVGHALVEAISERISLGVIDDIIKSNAPIWKKMLAGMGAEQIQEQGATLGGDVVDWATVAQEKTLGEFLAERPARMAQTALATLVASGGMQGTFLAIDYGTRAFMKDAVAAQKSPGDKLIDKLLNDAARSKLRTRAPEKAAELAGKLTEGTNAETVVIDLDGLAQSLEAAGLDITATMTEMGIPADAINETAIVMGQVEIPTSRLMVSNGIQAHRDKVQPHLRLASEDLTPAQKEVIGAEATRQAKKFSEAIAEDVARDADFAGQIAEVEEAVVTQLRDSGFSGQSSVLKANAVLASRMAAYVAKRRGQDVRDVWKEIGPTIVGQFAGAGMAQAQDVLVSQEGVGFETPGSPEYEAAIARGLDMSTPARMARAKEMGFDTETVLYHGTGANITEFKIGVGAGSVEGVFLTGDPKMAGIYARENGAIMPLYVRGQMMPFNQFAELQNRLGPASAKAEAEKLGFAGVQYDGMSLVFDPSNIRSVHAAFDPDNTGSANLLAQSIRTSVQMPMAEVDAWVRANVTATESDMPNGDTLTVIRFPLTQDQGAPEVMLSIRLSDKNGRADVNLFLDNQMADSLESVEDPVQRGVLAKMMFAKTVMVMRQYAAEYDVKAFNFTAAESHAEGTNTKSREALYRYMLSTLKMDGYTAYEIENQTSVVNQDEAGEKTANPMLNMAGFVLVRDGVNVEEYARNEILRGSRRGRGEIVTALTAKRLGRADTGQRGGRGRGGTGPADAGGVFPADGGLAQTVINRPDVQDALEDPQTDVLPLTEDMQILNLDEFIAFHGTLAKFDKFETDKIGAGEGAQAFGPGHYFTQSRGIADWYRKRMKQLAPGLKLGKEPFNKANPVHFALAQYWQFRNKNLYHDLFGGYKSTVADSSHEGAIERAIKWVQYEIDGMRDPYIRRQPNEYASPERPVIRDKEELIRFLEAGIAHLRTLDPKSSKGIPRPSRRALRGGGNIYTVAIKLPAEQTIQYDKPFGQQPQAVQKAFREAAEAGHLGKAGAALEKYGDATRMDVLVAALKNMNSPAMDVMRANGIRGVRYLDGMSRGKKNKAGQSYNYVVFEDADVKVLDRTGFLYQSLEQTTRGGYSPATGTMVFTEARDLSTFMHETAHWFLDTLEKLAPTEAWAAADLAEIDAWYQSVKDTPALAAVRGRYAVTEGPGGFQITYQGQAIERPHATREEAEARIEWRERQEAFAETFEQYLQTGKASTPKLTDVFRAFRDWLVNLYRGLMPGERAALNPAIRDVFDRVLAVDAEVDAASAEAFRDADTMAKDMLAKGVITERQYKMVGERLNKAREEVKEEMIARALKEEMRTREQWWEKERARIKGELARAFDKSEVGRAFNWLAYGEWKGDTEVEPNQPVSDFVDEEYGALFQSAPTFYSALGRFIASSGTARAPASQWKGMISNAPGVKAEEVEWTGVMEWLDLQEGPVTREAVAEFAEANGVRVEEVRKGGGASVTEEAQRELLPLIEQRMELQSELERDYYTGVGPDSMEESERNAMFALERQVDDLNQRIENLQRTIDLGLDDAMGDTKWSSYTLPGGENYTELLLVVPGVDYVDSHFQDTKGTVAHVRYKERIGPNGERILAMEEIQSGIHQAGRERGYQDADTKAAVDKATADGVAARAAMIEALTHPSVVEKINARGTSSEKEMLGMVQRGMHITDQHLRTILMNFFRDPSLPDGVGAQMNAAIKAYEASDAAYRAAQQAMRSGIPNAPFKNNNWANLVLKRMIRHAAENGFDAIAWIPGNVQNGRIVEDTGDNRGDFYDKIVPNLANKLGKKYGAKVEKKTFDIPEFAFGLGLHTLPITPELSDAALSEGFPLFQTRTFNPPGHGPVPPPPDVPPVRLDLRIVREQYGDEAVGKLPAAVRRRSSTSSNVTDILQQIETVRKVLAKRRKGPQTLTQFIMRRKATMADGTKEDRAWGIKGASAELKAMGLDRLINEKTGRTLDYVREAAEEAGFIRPRPVDVDINTQAGDLDTTQNDLLDALAREAKGEAVVRPEDEGASKEMADARVWATWLEQNGVNIYETDKKKLKASVEAMLSQTDESLVSPDQAAEMFGFATGEELLAALAQVGNRDRFLNEQADRKMAEEFGDMMRDGTLIEEAREAARLSILGRQSEIELEALARAVGQQASANYARQMARDIIALRTVKEIAAYERDLDNERRFAKQALAAVQKGDYAGALKAKTRQLVAAQMYREGKKAHERIEKQRKDLLKYLTSESRRDKIARDYLDRIEAVLDDYELRVSKQGPSVQRERQSAAAYVAWMTEQGREAEIAPEAMLLATQASLKTWRGLTADEVEYLVGTIENLAHLGRTKQRLLNDKEKREREAILDELEATLLAAPSAKTERGKSFSPTVLENTAEWLRKAHARLTRMEFQFARLDGKEGGPLHTALFQPFADAADRETARMRGAAKEMQRLYKIFTPIERRALFHRRIATPELRAPGKGLTLMDAVVIGLNWGNAGNRQALIDGYGWDGEAIEAMLNRVLNDKHWDFIEGVWALVGSYREDAFALEKSITGVAPKAVEGTTFTLANGRKIEGKYYPLKYDSGQARADSVRQARLDEKQMLSEMGKSFSKPMTKTGHLIERVGSGGKPVKLSIGVFHEHVASVIHDIAYRRAIIDVYKLVTSTRFANAYIQAAGREQYDTLVPWIAQIANERKDEPGGYVTDLLRGARRNFSIMAMGLKVGTAVQQATGVLQGVPLIGSRYAAQGFFKALGGGPASFWSAWNWVSQKSEFMRDRPMGFDRDVREVTNRLQERTPLGFVRRNAFILIGVMDTAVSTGVWIGAYDKALDGNVPGVDKADEEAAIAYADSIVRRSQVAGRIQDLPQMMRGTELEKLMTVVYSYFSGLYNETASEVMRVRGGQLNPLSFAANMTLLYVVIPLMASALAGRLFAEDDDDELDEKIGKEIASNAVSTIPFARDVINATINPQFGYQLSPAGSIIEGGTKAAANIATGEGFASEYATKQTFNLLGLLFGLPTGQLWITGEYVYDVATGQEVPADDPADAVSEALLRDTR